MPEPGFNSFGALVRQKSKVELNGALKRGDGDQPNLNSVLHQFCGRTDAEYIHQIVLGFRGSGRDVQLSCDLFHRLSFSYQLKHFALTLGELRALVRHRAAGSLRQN